METKRRRGGATRNTITTGGGLGSLPDDIVQDALPGAGCASNGAYFHVWNVRQQAAAVVESGIWRATTAHKTDMHWQAYDLTYRDASQLVVWVAGPASSSSSVVILAASSLHAVLLSLRLGLTPLPA